MTKIQTVFWDKGVSPKAIQLLKLGKDIDGAYRGIQPLPANFSMGTNPQVTKFVFIADQVDLVAFMTDPTGSRDTFKGFKLLITNDASESFYLQLNYRVILWQLLDGHEDLQNAMGVEQLSSSPDGLNLKSLKHTVKAVKMFKDLELNLNSFIVLQDLVMPIKGTVKEVGGKWNKVHSPTKWKAKT